MLSASFQAEKEAYITVAEEVICQPIKRIHNIVMRIKSLFARRMTRNCREEAIQKFDGMEGMDARAVQNLLAAGGARG